MTEKHTRYTKCYGYNSLLEGKYGFWSVYGEDTNCDLSGVVAT